MKQKGLPNTTSLLIRQLKSNVLTILNGQSTMSYTTNTQSSHTSTTRWQQPPLNCGHLDTITTKYIRTTWPYSQPFIQHNLSNSHVRHQQITITPIKLNKPTQATQTTPKDHRYHSGYEGIRIQISLDCSQVKIFTYISQFQINGSCKRWCQSFFISP